MSQQRRIGPPGRMRPRAAAARPVHAGRLARWERLAFALAFAAMVAFVVVITISSAGLRGSGAPPPATGGAGGRPVPALGRGGPSRIAPRGAVTPVHADRDWSRRLAAALAPVLAGHSGTLGVGVIDRTTGAVAIYGGGRKFHTASIEKVAILAGLLLGRPGGLSDADGRVATTMIEASADGAANRLWNAAGRAPGMTAADVQLGLRHTVPGPAEDWGLTSTTVADQLTLAAGPDRGRVTAAGRGPVLRAQPDARHRPGPALGHLGGGQPGHAQRGQGRLAAGRLGGRDGQLGHQQHRSRRA